DRVAEHDVNGGPAAPHVVVVHRGQIVVDERVRVQHLEGRRGRERYLAGGAQCLGHRDRQGGPEALARSGRRITHRLDEPPRIIGRRSEPFCQLRVDHAGDLLEEPEQGRRGGGGGPGGAARGGGVGA